MSLSGLLPSWPMYRLRSALNCAFSIRKSTFIMVILVRYATKVAKLPWSGRIAEGFSDRVLTAKTDISVWKRRFL